MSVDFDKIFEKAILDEVLGSSEENISVNNDFFRMLCEKKINYDQTTDEITQHEKFINIVDELNHKFPFLNIHEFVEDFVNGVYNKNIIERYNFSKKSDFETCLRKNGLNLQQKRTKKLNSLDESKYARRQNLKIIQNLNSYEFIINESNFFKTEIDYLLNYNVARSIVLLKFLNGKTKINEILKNEKFFGHDNIEYFEVKLTEDIIKIIKEKFDDIQLELYQKRIIQFKDDHYETESNFDDIENSIKEIINNEIEGITYGKLVSTLTIRYNLVSLIPNYSIITKILKKYEEQGIIKVESGFGNSGVTDNRYFSIVNSISDKFSENIRQGSHPFFGRLNDSFQFIEDIKFLRKGDFDDEDDQVTRIAGLILAGTQKMISEPEKFSEFDFAVNMADFSPTPEQLKIMEQSKIVLDPTCKIVHLKVMINEEVTPETVKSIQEILPECEQSIIISFEKIPEVVQNSISKDHSIQIIGKKDLQLWAEITPEIPSRKGSIIKIMSGKHVGKIARLSYTNYETGKATVELIPSLIEEVEYIGYLKEIELFEDPIMDEYVTMSQNYYEFLSIIVKNSEITEFQKSIFNITENSKNLFVDRDKWELKENELFTAKFNQFICKIDLAKTIFGDVFNCTCDYFQTKENFCMHLISLLNELGIRNNFFSETWGQENENLLFACLKNLIHNK